MQTLIELFDERPLENVLGVEMFRPERVVFVCPQALAPDERRRKKMQAYFRHRGIDTEIAFVTARVFDTEAMLRLLRKVVGSYPDCALDITGGTDAVLFAAGLLCSEVSIPVFTYSRRRNRFFNIRNADFAANLPCSVSLSVEDCFLMAGGSMRQGRVDNSVLDRYMDDIDPFFQMYLRNRSQWNNIVTYIQRLSPTIPDQPISLEAEGSYTVKGERASRISAPEAALRELEEIGFLRDLSIEPEKSVSFRFRDAHIRTWLRDVGSVLELYVYRVCRDTGLFRDVRLSAIVDWEGSGKQNAVTNELDVMCTRGITPVFISCKTCDVKTEALNELAVLRDRFGGNIAKAAIVTAEKGGAAMRNRAAELNIAVMDLHDLTTGEIDGRIRAMMQ